LPLPAVRDLLGLLRAMHAAAPPERARHRAAIRACSRDLQRAVDLARECPPGSEGHRQAWALAERAVARLADLVDVTTPAAPIVATAGDRIRARSR
jgi:hypothetical protein